MGANATTSVPSYVAGEVLAAADLNVTNSGIPVFANSTDRTNGFGGSGEKTLAEGQYAYLESDDKTYVYDGAAWKEVGSAGLVLVSSTTIGSAVSSVTVSSAFSSTYDNYKIIISGGVASTTCGLRMTLGSTATGYYFAGYYTGATWAATVNGDGAANTTFWTVGNGTTNILSGNIEVIAPNLAKMTSYSSVFVSGLTTNGYGQHNQGVLNDTTQYTAFTITTSTGTMTGGTVKVYGYVNS